MSEPNFSIANQKIRQFQGLPLNSLVTRDTSDMFLSTNVIIHIANNISASIGRKMTSGEISLLQDFIQNSSRTPYTDITLRLACQKFATNFLARNRLKAEIVKNNIETSVVTLANLDEITTDPTMVDYQVKEIKQFTKNENQYKYDAFADRRGDAVVDSGRVNGNRSSPDGLPSGKKLSIDEVYASQYKTSKILEQVFNPKSIDELIGRFSNTYSTFLSVNLPHQTVPLDSRNRLITNSSLTEYSWNIHTAGQFGSQGDIKIQDTLQQVIQMSLGGFWLPMTPITGSYYDKIHMLVKEFSSQSIFVSEFLSSNNNRPTVSYYHFEFNITQTSGSKVFLEPVKRSYEFRKPISQVNTLTINFRTPFGQLILPPDRGVFTMTFGNPTIFDITSDPAHGLATGDLIYILNAATGNTIIDKLITREEGYIITKISATSFSIALDTSSLGGTETGISIYYGSKRIFLQLEFTTLEQ